ncbi:hypothetical protein DAETH_06920 [Deinococcus aetherius]|uniref:FAS1 domain-containing protein n=1 Tax=Deinococcus aetherius TaxID=200252 RepID=A0ABN6RBI9_9DEIO|nr:fasciclin domain-containing protein [Deinococcus aetherius]BDP40723.1 hypothetical protein DAETH_06920 [Deinococcus aetherius]
MKKQTSLITLSLLLATPALAGGGGAPATRPATATACQPIAQLITNDPQFSTLLTAVQAAGLAETLSSGQYTVFAPTNAAFAKLPSDTLAAVLNDPEQLRAVLLYHVVPGKVTSQQVRSLRSVKTAQGGNLTVSVSGNTVRINNANVIRADLSACNGVVHVIDAVLVPPAAAAPAAATPAPAPAPAPAAEAPAPAATTPAAPAPAATTPAAPVAVTSFDVRSIPSLPLTGATVSSTGTATSTTTDSAATTTTTDTAATTTTDTATTATDTTTTDTATATTDTATTATTDTATATTDTTASADTSATVQANTLYDVIVADDRFSTLRDLLSDAGLTEMLTTGEYTVFAPTNEAFAAVPADTLAVLASNPEALRQVLSYHVVAGRQTAQGLAGATQLTSAEGSALPLSLSGTTQQVGSATVTETITTASNGTIFVINQVLLPPNLTLPAPASDTSSTSTDTAAGTATTGTATTGTGTASGTSTTGTTGTSTTDTSTTGSGTTSTTTGTTGTTGTTTTGATGTSTGTAATGTTGTATGTTSTGTTTGATATGTGVTGTSAGTIGTAGASTTGTTGAPAGSTIAAPSTAPGSGTSANTATTTRDNTTLATLIASDNRFTTLARLVQVAGLTETLASGTYTIFAPTNDAFLKLSPSDLNALTADPARLRQVLLYHVVPTRVTGTALATASQLTTAQSGVLTITRPSGSNAAGTRTLINGANLQPSSIDAGNGILYAIDNVLLPPTTR